MADQAFNLRSISFPFRSRPATLRVEEELDKVRTCAASSTTEAVCDGLRGLGEVYEEIDELLRQPGNQQSFSHPKHRKWVEEELDLSLQLLDLSGAIRDGLSATTAHLQDIQLSIRRKDCSNAKIKAFHYDSTRFRSTKKSITNSLRSLQKQMENGRKIAPCSGVAAMLVEAREISVSLFGSASSLLTEATGKPKGSRWSSFVTRQLHHKKVACGVHEVESEGESLVALLSSIQKLDFELESLFRRLIRNRVSLLNVLSF
ncbi:hypothetical protein M5K25_018663 [Dendrobium thyrsiflorum]|uniref:Uncharacterized protein n=1 Tax=Dendrobium thyrsiflorum TaxID=117978 RepID=A0ABD0UIK3_DENTH